MISINLNINVTKSYYSFSGDRKSKKKEIGLMEVVKNFCMKVYPYLIICKVVWMFASFFIG